MLIENYSTILKKERTKDVIPFLKSLNKDGKKEIASALKPLAKEYNEYKEVKSLIGVTFKQKGTPDQLRILQATAFVCLNRKDYQKFDAFHNILNNPFLTEILPWYCPDWFSAYLNELGKREYIPWTFSYDFAMVLIEKGYVTLSDEVIVRLIPQMIFTIDAKNNRVVDREYLTRRRITLQEHIWLIFQHETTINYTDRYFNFTPGSKEEHVWMELFKDHIKNGAIERERFLKECILATGRNFNKALSGWFVDLFDFLEPTPDELVRLQPELLNALSSQHSKAVNTALNKFKLIIADEEFDSKGFIDNAPLLLSSETKSVVSSTLILFEKLLKKHPELKEEICLALCQSFIHNDEGIQNKAAKLLLKYGDGLRAVSEEVNRYSESMLMSARNLLSDLIVRSEPVAENVIEITPVQNQHEPVQSISSLDELVFLASQAFDNNDPMHIDLLPAALVNLQSEVGGENLRKFEPALQRAYNLVMNDWSSTVGFLDHLLATFFIDMTKLFIQRFPTEGTSLQIVHQSFKQKDDENKAKWKWYKSRIPELETWSVESRDNTYIIHKTILLVAYERLKDHNVLPILSTPTHCNGYVDPLVLVARFEHYQRKNVLPENYDLQLAISRIAPFNHSEALKVARERLTGEIVHIMEFLLEKETLPKGPFTTPSLWFMAGITKAPDASYAEFKNLFYSSLPSSTFTGNVSWRSFEEHFTVMRYNFEKKKQEEVPDKHNVMRLRVPETPIVWRESSTKPEGFLAKLAKIFTAADSPKREQVYVLYELLSLRAKWMSSEQNDIQRFVYMFPSNPNPLLSLVANRCLVHSTFSSETDRKMVTKTLEALMNLEFQFCAITHLFIGSCMLTSDKTVRSFAAEVWIKAVTGKQEMSKEVGEVIGIHLTGGYAPLKRLTELLSTNLMKISRQHNTALEVMLTSIIEKLPIEAPVGTKRLLELYLETIGINQSSATSMELKNRLASWNGSAGLKKVIDSIMKSNVEVAPL